MRKSTLGNKFVAINLLLASLIIMLIEREATGFIFMCCIAIPLFFAKKNYVMWN